MKKRKISPNNIYNASIVYTFFKFKFKDIEFEIDGESNKGKCTILTVCNGEIYGGGYKIAPEAKLQDGYFDIYYVDKMQKLSLPMLISKLKKGTHTTHKKVHRSKATSIKFKSNYDLICNIDGEIEINKKFDIKLLPKEITIYNNQDLVKRFLK
jgi:diacylglycerol kinase family enzyme